MCGYIDLAAEGCGGPNEFTRRARQTLDTVERALDTCLQRFGRKPGHARSRTVKRNPNAGRTVRYSMPESSCTEGPEL